MTDNARLGVYELHAVMVDPTRNQICRGACAVQLEPKVMDVLCALLERRGMVVSREDLISRVWKLEFGSDESITRAISLLRRAFRDADGDREYIETVPKRGYRIIADVRAAEALPTPAQTPAADLKAAPRQTSIAVLAFADMSPASDQEHFSDGVAEEIINALLHVPGLRVIGRTSSFAFKSREETIPSIAASLNVSHILQGSVRKHGHRLRISAQLIDAESEHHLWSQTFDGDYDDVFDLQEKIASATATSLRALFDDGTPPPSRLAEKLTSSHEAYDLFLRGRSLSARMTGTDGTLQQAVACLERAVALDPGFVEGWAELANAYAYVGVYTPINDRHGMIARSFAAAARAIDLRPDYGFPRTVQSLCRSAAGDVNGALRLSLEGMYLDPENSNAIMRHGYHLAVIGRVKDALPLLQRSVDLDPLQGRNLGVLAQAYLCMGDNASAESCARRALQLGYHGAIQTFASAAYARGEYDLAIERLLLESSALGAMFWPEYATPDLWQLASKGFYSGKTEDRELLVRGMQMVAQMSERKNELSLPVAMMLTGAAQEFFDLYGPKSHPGASLMLLNLWTNIDPSCHMRDHPGFRAFADRIGFTEAWREYGRPDVWESNAPD